MPRLLVLHYSLTGQAARASALICAEAAARGWEVSSRRIVFTPGERTPTRPFKIADAKFWTQSAQRGTTFKVGLDDLSLPGQPFDGAVILSNTWGDAPAVPIQSFLRSPPAPALLAGVPCGLFIVCRRLWRKNAMASHALIEAAGGRVVETVPLVHHGGQVGSLVQTVTHMFRSGDGSRASLLGVPLPPFGLSDASLAAIPPATATMLKAMHDRHA
ncbi:MULTISPECIES: hypothetical protein [unclassified Novosphingobium]|uniref:hypothetical protein n=1 Tax=unclassified Novosphingobium TaxID=2644732 RepID=UPI00135B266B|nr:MULTISPECIES: hypothetical protein [unclassified Novosphingobium]